MFKVSFKFEYGLTFLDFKSKALLKCLALFADNTTKTAKERNLLFLESVHPPPSPANLGLDLPLSCSNCLSLFQSLGQVAELRLFHRVAKFAVRTPISIKIILAKFLHLYYGSFAEQGFLSRGRYSTATM